MHPAVKPALRRAWRDLQYVQYGVTAAHAVVVGPVDTTTGSLLGLLDGTRGTELLRREARALGVPDGWLEGLLRRLAGAGLLDDRAAGDPAVEALRRRDGALDRLRADLASLSVVHREPGGALRRLAARGGMRVRVRGAGRVGAGVAALLSAAGVGEVEVLDGGCVEPWDVSPGGHPAESVGKRRDVSARRLVSGSAPPEAGHRPRGQAAEPALTVIAPREGLEAYAPDPVTADRWVESGVPHLFTGLLEATGVVGPLVVPGGTACGRCLELHRTDGDPVWPRMLAQWRSGRRGTGPAGDVALVSAVAGLAAAHALAFLDGSPPASAGARWEVASPLLEWRSHRVEPHAECPCGAAAGRSDVGAVVAGSRQDTMAG
ncbi:TOMM precursor leader peptide-binding protein [Streptomyces sp. MUM 203J]|uniref:TOMM precursor leader peptide-binding protein n=1 Tax=Streptomyces sp. MUM 203J TaxID=2791990 RepID=UPI001F041D69|nr:TOMM precursor leader peptide-binding protein [Streptomyces sp. MUM 203J]MCH0541324.1 TOMM precursor leader peptide-binding protein [Streptomyces sp. MUM 203J]